MKIEFEYPNIRELLISKIEVVDKSGKAVGTFILQTKENIWYAALDVASTQFVYKFLLNGEIYLNDPYASEFAVFDGEVWSIRYGEKSEEYKLIERVDVFDIIVSNQMNLSVQASKVHKIFLPQFDKRVNVGIECYSVAGVHELIVIWCCPGQRTYHIDYKVLEPEQEGEMYGIIVWFKLKLEDIEREFLNGIWIAKVLLDGVLIGFETFQVVESFVDDL